MVVMEVDLSRKPCLLSIINLNSAYSLISLRIPTIKRENNAFSDHTNLLNVKFLTFCCLIAVIFIETAKQYELTALNSTSVFPDVPIFIKIKPSVLNF